MCSRPALPNICGANGRCSGSRTSNIVIRCLSIGFVRSVYLTPSEPFSIFSKPSASAQSASPPRTAWRAMYSADEPVEQLLLTFTTGMPVRPEPVDGALAGGRLAVAVADEGLLDVVVGDAGVLERLRARLARHVGVVPVPRARLLELGHADADHEGAVAHVFGLPVAVAGCSESRGWYGGSVVVRV